MLDRITIEEKTYLKGYHTQEYRSTAPLLEKPILCIKNAWLGPGYYFWAEIEFAKYWGEDYKKAKEGYYDIYHANLDIDSCINSSFDEVGYFFLKEKIECVIHHFRTKGINITLLQLNRYLKKEFWDKLGITGIIYDDLPSNPHNKPNRMYSEVEYTIDNNKKQHFYYKKRIQVVIFDLKDVTNFDIYLEEQE